MAPSANDLMAMLAAVALAGIGVASSIHPISVPPAEVIVTLACGLAALLLLLPNRAGLIPRGRGLWLLALYGGFIWATLTMPTMGR
ncbi:MAG: hypothetical protein Q8O25_08020 [Sulfurisoma sp.]|nr:hypothetical protein [Sulfurisoma sp.]